MVNKIKNIIQDSVSVKQIILNDEILLDKISKTIDLIVNCYKSNGKVFFCGNGGSAADAQHLAAELSGRFYFDRDPLYAEALHVNTSYITAVANDYSYDEIYSRYIKGSGRKGDILIGLSTSGKSKNILKAFRTAKEQEMICIGMCGNYSEDFEKFCDITLNVPSDNTPRIQESHILIGHTICQFVEEKIFKK